MPRGSRRSLSNNRHRQIVAAVVAARKAAGLSQTDLADALGLNQSDISKLENGERKLELIEFLEIAELLSKRTGQVGILNQLLAASKKVG
jgi:transcriptional regulator with XRE-family HTH domain